MCIVTADIQLPIKLMSGCSGTGYNGHDTPLRTSLEANLPILVCKVSLHLAVRFRAVGCTPIFYSSVLPWISLVGQTNADNAPARRITRRSTRSSLSQAGVIGIARTDQELENQSVRRSRTAGGCYAAKREWLRRRPRWRTPRSEGGLGLLSSMIIVCTNEST